MDGELTPHMQPGGILIVEDDPDFASSISEYLTLHGMHVVVLSTAAGLVEFVQQHQPSVLILDQFVGDADLLDSVPKLRRVHAGPIVVLSGNADPIDRILSLERGADDHIFKGTSPREVLARIRAVQRRESAPPVSAKGGGRGGKQVASLDDWTLDRQTRELTSPAGPSCTLTPQESEIAWLFFNSPRTTIPRDELVNGTIPGTVEMNGRRIDNLVSRLRRRVSELGGTALFESVRGKGYGLHGIVLTPASSQHGAAATPQAGA